MKNQLNYYSIILVAMIALSVTADGQIAAGGSFTLDQTVIAGGGGSDSSGGNFKVEGTIGQAAAGVRSTVAPFNTQNGFWTGEPLGPTAAEVTLSGQVKNASGRGIKRARLTLLLPDGTTRVVLSNQFGYYRFENIAVGQTYLLTVTAKHYIFANSPMALSVNDELVGVDFVADH